MQRTQNKPKEQESIETESKKAELYKTRGQEKAKEELKMRIEKYLPK